MADATIAAKYLTNPLNTWAGTEKIPLDDAGTGKVGLASTLKNYVASALAVGTLAGGTITTSQPMTHTQTWNDGSVTFVGKSNDYTSTASAAGSLVERWRVGGSVVAQIDKSGNIAARQYQTDGTSGSTVYYAGSIYYNGNISIAFTGIAGVVGLMGSATFGWNSSTTDASTTLDTILGRNAAASLRLGAADAASPVAQTLGVQSVVAGTTDTAGADWTFKASASTGTGDGGDYVWQRTGKGSTGTSVNTYYEYMRLGYYNAGGNNGVQLDLGPSYTGGAGEPTASRIVFHVQDVSWTLLGGYNNFDFSAQGDSLRIWNYPYRGATTINTGIFGWTDGTLSGTTDTFLKRRAAASVQLGEADAAVAVAQTLTVQGVVAGTSNVAGADWTIAGSQGTGTGVGGDIVFKTAPAGGSGTSQNALAEVIRILNTGNIKFTNAANFSANNTVATVLGSVGPTGANTTVQEWLTFKNAAGTTRYVPCF